MTVRRTAALVLVAALATLVASVTWAFAQGSDQRWSMSRFGSGMMGFASTGSGTPVTDLVGAKRQARRFASRLDLRVGEVMQFENNYYAELIESNGDRATEVLVDARTGAVWFEFGPAMMWNTRYGMMSGQGMMGGGSGSGWMMGGENRRDSTWAPAPATTTPSVSAEEARTVATRWLTLEGSKLRAGTADAFPGYYTVHVLQGNRIAGMLSVNAYTGAVWYHWWHGPFLSMTE